MRKVFPEVKRLESYSPLRVSFLGGGTDISPFLEKHGSRVFNTTIDRGVHITYTEDDYPLEVSSRDFLKTVIMGNEHGKNFQNKILELLMKNGIKKGKIYINGEVPPGSGLASSSAMITALMRLILELNENYHDPMQLAKLSYEEEKEFFGITLGIQDPYAISVGGFKYMQADGKEVKIEKFQENRFLEDIGKGMLICYTGGTRESSEVLKNQVRKSADEDSETIVKLNKIRELTLKLVESVREEDYLKFTGLINEGWEIKKTLSSKVSSANVDNIIRTALSNGADSARLLGGGNQGFVLAIGKQDRLWDVQKSLMTLSDFVVRVNPMESGTTLFDRSF
ncbi:MAG: GHMP family kinase ATP-binding protein [Cuniculiplasma sp.]